MYMKSVKRQLVQLIRPSTRLRKSRDDVFGDSNSKITLQYNGKELTVRNTEIDMNFVKKASRESNGEL